MPVAKMALALIVLAPLATAPAKAPVPKAEPQSDEIVVTGLSRPSTLNAKELRRAVKAHAKGRALYAPHSRLFFMVKAVPNDRSLHGSTLTFRSKGGIVPVILDADRRFVLPPLPGKGWKLVANRRVGSFEILPLVMSPGTSDADRLLGDLRLQCAVLWTMVKPDLSILLRATASALGGMCRSSVIPFFGWSDRAIAEASVRTGALTQPVDVTKDRYAYCPRCMTKCCPTRRGYVSAISRLQPYLWNARGRPNAAVPPFTPRHRRRRPCSRQSRSLDAGMARADAEPNLTDARDPFYARAVVRS